MAVIPKERILGFRGQNLHDRDGEPIGAIEEMYLDAETGEPEWALVNTGMFGTKLHFVPLRDATEADDRLRVPLEKDRIKDAPKVEPNGQLTQDDEAELFRFYGLQPDVPPAADDDAPAAEEPPGA